MSSKLCKIQVGKSKFGRSFPSSEDNPTLHKQLREGTTERWAVKIWTVEAPQQKFQNELNMKREAVSAVWMFFGFEKKKKKKTSQTILCIIS